MLNENPQFRPSAEECLAHAWFHKNYEPLYVSDWIFSHILMEGFNFNVINFLFSPRQNFKKQLGAFM